MIEISISGKQGPYLKQNEFDWDSTISQNDIWARSKDNPEPKHWGNPKRFERCEVGILIEEVAEDTTEEGSVDIPDNTPPPPFDWRAFQKIIEAEVQEILENPEVMYDLEHSKQLFKTQWKLDGIDITEVLDHHLYNARSDGRNINITNIKVSKKGPQILGINLTTN